MAAGDNGGQATLLAMARTMGADRVTAEVVAAFRSAGIRSILLKGPALARWLYDNGSRREYVDADLLVSPQEFGRAEQVLARLGFAEVEEDMELPKRGLVHAQAWERHPDLPPIDLHRTPFGVGVAPEEAWRALSGITETMAVAGTPVEVLSSPGRALVVALHAAQHRTEFAQPIEDLARAIERLPLEIWSEAAELAARLDATPTLAIGLRLLPDGVELAERLELVSAELIETAIRRGSPAEVALGFERLAQRSGLRAKLAMLARELVPTRSFMRWWSPLARRGWAGLALAYLWRPLWLLWQAGPSLRAWRRSRRERGARSTGSV
jgi:hypothetical protein